MTSDPLSPPEDDWFDIDAVDASAFSRRAMMWLVGMFLVVLVSIALLAVFLQAVEAQEEERRRTADAEWLDQTLRFHFRRLEGDLASLALDAQGRDAEAGSLLRAGAFWRSPGLIVFHGWIPARQQPFVDAWPAFLQAAAGHPENAGSLASMLDTTRGLQRAAYAGPLVGVEGARGPTLWLAVPLFERGVFQGDYVAAVEVDRVLAQAVPAWFLKEHAVSVMDEMQPSPLDRPAPDHSSRYVVPINLPGAQWKLTVDVLSSEPSLAPRAFFGVALACLLGMLLSLFFLWRDIARRRRAESRLQTQMALRMAMERSVTLGLRAWDLKGRLLYVNQAFCRMVGWTSSELMLHEGPPPYWPLEQGSEFHLIRQEVTVPQQQQMGVEMHLNHRDGHRVEVLVHGAPLSLADGTVIGWIGSSLDITERRRIEQLAARQQEKLEASGRLIAVGEVASTLAHELNQPLGALSSFANGLLNRVREGRITLEEVVPVVERMDRIAEKAGRVIHRVNAFARRQEMSRQPLELTSFIQRVVGHQVWPDAVAHEVCLPQGECMLPADAMLLEHALSNVVLNASEWAPRSSIQQASVRVSLEVGAAMAGIRVEDTGPGVPSEQQHTIFDAFTSQKPHGMGMGLSICRSIIEAHHGRIEVDRSADLGGARFTLWLPLEA